MQKDDFDIYTKGEDSPSKQTLKYSLGKKGKKTPLEEQLILDPDQLKKNKMELLLEERQIKQTDDFKNLGVKQENKMLFYLLKWIFNAIKIESDEDDPQLKGHDYIKKVDLVKQLQKNKNLVETLKFKNMKEVKDTIKVAGCRKENCFIWQEFLDYFFLKDIKDEDKVKVEDHWWREIEKPVDQEEEKAA